MNKTNESPCKIYR